MPKIDRSPENNEDEEVQTDEDTVNNIERLMLKKIYALNLT